MTLHKLSPVRSEGVRQRREIVRVRFNKGEKGLDLLIAGIDTRASLQRDAQRLNDFI